MSAHKRKTDEPAPTDAVERTRLDKWLWRARFYKTRVIASEAVERGRVRVNGVRTVKPGAGVKCGDVLTVATPGGVHVIEILAHGERRGPASEAQALYAPIDETRNDAD